MCVFGLDFGTTNSTLSMMCGGGVSVLDVDIVQGKPQQTLSSAIFFDIETGCVFVGEKAIQHYVVDHMAGRFMRSVKTLLPSKVFTGTTIMGTTNMGVTIIPRRYQADDLVAIIIREIKKRGENQVGHEVDSVVLGRPVIFSEDEDIDRMAQERLLSAAHKAGFKHIQLQYEPVGAALAFEKAFPSDKEEVVFVGDFGGGTSDFTIMKVGGDLRTKYNRRNDILGLGGAYIGGDSFDSLLMWEKMARYFGRGVTWRIGEKTMPIPAYIVSALRQWHLISLLRELKTRETICQIRRTADRPEIIRNLENLVDDNTGIELFRSVEQAKCMLTDAESTMITFEHITEHITRPEFEAAIIESCDKIEECAAGILRQANLTPHNIDHVFLTGGTSRVPLVRRTFIRMFGAEKIREQDAFTSVGYGLGLSATSFT